MTRSERSMDLQEQELAALDKKLLRSVSEKKPSWTAELLEQGADPDAKFSNGVPALVQAATDPCKEVMQALLAAGADASARTQAGMSALMWAVIKDPTMIPMLIDGSDPDAAEKWLNDAAAVENDLDRFRPDELSDPPRLKASAVALRTTIEVARARLAKIAAAEKFAGDTDEALQRYIDETRRLGIEREPAVVARRPLTDPDRRDFIMLGVGAAAVLAAGATGYALARLLGRGPGE